MIDAEALLALRGEAEGVLTILSHDTLFNSDALAGGEVRVDSVAITSGIEVADRIGSYDRESLEVIATVRCMDHLTYSGQRATAESGIRSSANRSGATRGKRRCRLG